MFSKLYLKYIIKSSTVFGLYICIFGVIFIILANGVHLQERQKYVAKIHGKNISIVNEKEVSLVDKKIYVYVDKNQKVLSFQIVTAEYRNGKTYFTIDETQEEFEGDVFVEISTGERSLFQAIFSKEDSNK